MTFNPDASFGADRPERKFAPWLWTLIAIFVFRVVAQPASLWLNTPFLPAFDVWHSGTLPYVWLLASQLVIIVVMVSVAWRYSTGVVIPRRSVGLATLAFGAIYFLGMAMRLLLGATMFRDDRWFAARLPTLFHLALAAFPLLVGWFHLRRDREAD